MNNVYEVKTAVRDFYLKYAMKVIVSRALPDVRDGLKPIHRRIIYSMYRQGLLTGQMQKVNTILGEVMKIHAHGDSSITEAINRMTDENGTLLHAFIQGQGNFGKVYSDESANAPRYLDAKLTDIAKEMLKDFNKNTVDMISDYNEIGYEPLTLPSSFPNILVMGSSGIAVAYASEIPSFNLKEVCDTTIEYIKDKNIKIEDYLIAPDFSTKGEIIYDKKQIRDIYKKGTGKIDIRSKYTYDKENHLIEVLEIPYTTSVDKIVAKVTELIREKKIQGVLDIRDETGFNEETGETGLNITINLAKNTDPDKLMNILFKKTPLQDSFSCNMNALVDYKPRVLGIKDILDEWIKYRIKCIQRSTKFDIEKKTKELHFLSGLKKVLLDIDKAIEIIRQTKDSDLIINNLMMEFNIDDSQANQIAEMKLRNLNEKNVLKKISDIEKLEEEVENLKSILDDEDKVKNIIIEQLLHVKKQYGEERKTTLVDASEIKQFSSSEIEVEDYNVKVYITDSGYVKKVKLTSIKSSSDQRLKDDDFIVSEFNCTNKGELICLTDQRNAYKIRLHELSDQKLSNFGDYLPSLFNLKDEEIVYAFATTNFNESLLIGWESGKLSKILASAYSTSTNRKLLKNAYSDKDTPIFFKLITEDIDLLAVSDINKAILLSTEKVSAKSSKGTSGNTFQKQKNDSKTIGFYTLDQCNLDNNEYYRNSAPGIGRYLKEKDVIIK